MTKETDLGLPSQIKDLTHQQNREKQLKELRDKVDQAEREVLELEAMIKKIKGD